MASKALVTFLNKVGKSIFHINTICVGLNGVETGACTKADKLTVTWATKDPVNAAREARRFVIGASLAFVTDALMEYINYTIAHPNFNIKSKTSTNNSQLSYAEKISNVAQSIPASEKYWVPLVKLMIHWRNRLNHNNSKAKLNTEEIKLLRENKEKIFENHAAIDIEKTLNNFETSKITLKDASTLIAVTIKYVRQIDTQFLNAPTTFESVLYEIDNIDAREELINIMRINIPSLKLRKLDNFLKMKFGHIPEELFNALCKASPTELLH
jgi:hypothetical protein